MKRGMTNPRHNPATSATAKKNAEVYERLDFNDRQEAEFARRGLIAAPKGLVIKHEDGHVIWDGDAGPVDCAEHGRSEVVCREEEPGRLWEVLQPLDELPASFAAFRILP